MSAVTREAFLQDGIDGTEEGRPYGALYFPSDHPKKYTSSCITLQVRLPYGILMDFNVFDVNSTFADLNQALTTIDSLECGRVPDADEAEKPVTIVWAKASDGVQIDVQPTETPATYGVELRSAMIVWMEWK